MKMLQHTLLVATSLIAIVTAAPSNVRLGIRDSLNTPDIGAITAVDPSSFRSYPANTVARGGTSIDKRVLIECPKSAIFTFGDADNGGKGIIITNGGSGWYGFYIYHNSCDSVPYKYIWIDAGQTQFVSLPDLFEGRITRGNDQINLAGRPQLLGTWFEFSFDRNGAIWGDVSLIRGTDEGVLMWSTDGSGAWKGFTHDVMSMAPSGAWAQKPSGTWVLAPTEGPMGNEATRNYLLGTVGPELVYCDDRHGNPVITSGNGRFGTWVRITLDLLVFIQLLPPKHANYFPITNKKFAFSGCPAEFSLIS
jgi:hypothetical protein